LPDLQKIEQKIDFSFARHETFHLRDGWLYKGMREINRDPEYMKLENAHWGLGIGSNMLRAVRYWLLASGMVTSAAVDAKSALKLSEIGEILHRVDPYLEDTASIWVVHHGIATNQKLATFWYWMFNQGVRREFTVDEIINDLVNYLKEQGANRFAINSLRKDALCFVRTYATSLSKSRRESIEDSLDCPLAQLGLLQMTSSGRNRLVSSNRPDLSQDVFSYGLDFYRKNTDPQRRTFSIDELQWRPLSPGRIFGLDPDSLLQFLEKQTDYLRIVRTAGVNSVTFLEAPNPLAFLRRYYQVGERISA
jgi:hypothetical protein